MIECKGFLCTEFYSQVKSSHPSPNQILLYCQWRTGIYSLNIGIRLCSGLCQDDCIGGDSGPNCKKLCKNYGSGDQLLFIGRSGSNVGAFYLYRATSAGLMVCSHCMRLGTGLGLGSNGFLYYAMCSVHTTQ